MIEAETRASPLANLFLALVLFFSFGAVVLFAMMVGLTGARDDMRDSDAIVGGLESLEFYPPRQSDTEIWRMIPSAAHILETTPGAEQPCVFSCQHKTDPISGHWC